MAKKNLEIIQTEALKRFEIVQDKERDQRRLAVEDMKFANVEEGQWDEDAITKRQDRPRYTINRVAGAIDQLVGDQRQNRTQIKVRPVTGGADEEIANIYNGLIRNIEAQSKAENAYDAGFDETVTGGYGGWRVLTEFNDDDSFEQDIKIRPITSAATSLWFDPGSKEYDKRDSKWAFVTTEMPKEEYEARFPDALISDYPTERLNNSSCSSWFRDDVVRVAEYWVKQPVKKRIGLMTDGKVIDLDEEAAVLDELAQKGITVKKERTVKSFKVKMYLLNGIEILDGPKDWAGKFIPLIPCYGKVSNIEGSTYIRGLVRFAKDPQRIYNYATSAAIEAAALTPKDPYWLTATQASGYENQFKTFNQKNQPFLFYNGDPKAPGTPQRTGAPQVQSALIEQVRQAATDIHSTTGLEPSSLGNNPELQSGKAIMAQQAMGDRGSFIFQDNLSKSIQYTGDILVDLIPKIYDTERQVRVLGFDGKSEVVGINEESLNEFNQPVLDTQTGDTVIVNDLSKGKYDVVTETGPAFNTMRKESAQQLIDLATGSPVFEQLATDLIAKNLNILENDELTKRVRHMMIKQGTVQPTDEEIKELGLDQPTPPDPTAEAVKDNIEMQTEKLMSDINKQDADTQKSLIQTQGETIKTLKTLMDAYKTQSEIGIPFSQQDHDVRISQQDITEDGQELAAPGPNSAQAQEIVNLQAGGPLS